MDNYNVQSNVFSGFLWRFAERSGAQGVSFVVTIILARLLAPQDFGTLALITIIIAILQVFVDSGMGNALIQKKDADDLDFSTVFYLNLLICLILYIVMFIGAPFIAKFYGNDQLILLIRVLSLTLIISGVRNIQQAYVSKHMLFKRFFFATLGGTIGAAVIGIGLAFMGLGVWALVVQHLFLTLVDTLILWITVKWRPKIMFSFKRMVTLYSYGWKLLASSLLEVLYNNMQQLVIGKLYSTSDLAYYNSGRQFPSLAITNVNASIDSVLFPAISNVQNDSAKVKSMTRRAIRISSYIIWPIMIGLGVIAEPLISLLMTDKWLPSVPYLQIFCFVYGFWPIHTANLNAIKALGRSDIFLKLEILKKAIGLISLFVSMRYGVMAIAMAFAITTPISVFINITPNVKLLGYSYKEQLADILPSIGLAGLMGVAVYSIQFLHFESFLKLVIQVIAGIIIYITLSKFFRIESYYYVQRMIINIIKKPNIRIRN
ncbi:lipopolysaccharide biosynthesis protein [Neobacillus rhizosphaerae]|uniref:lipopolysaccharide biosynthesis protein n=1 Tax=Neobacillus rhizosphaerae TaxID=2880965 RepID=UPI003D270E46